MLRKNIMSEHLSEDYNVFHVRLQVFENRISTVAQ